MEKFQRLMDMTKTISDNIRMIHRNLIGDNWFHTHELLGTWYEYIDTVQDDVIEIGIALGGVVEHNAGFGDYPKVPVGKKYTEVEAFQYVYNFFNDLANAIVETEDEIPGYYYGQLESYCYYLKKEANFKIKSRLK